MEAKTRKLSPRLFVARREELKVAKLEIDSSYVSEKIPHDIGQAITKVQYLIKGSKEWINNIMFIFWKLSQGNWNIDATSSILAETNDLVIPDTPKLYSISLL